MANITYKLRAPSVALTPQQAGDFAQLAMDVGAWAGTKGEMRAVILWRDDSDNYHVRVEGVKTEDHTAINFEDGVEVVGVG
jgi:hypothetical protein